MMTVPVRTPVTFHLLHARQWLEMVTACPRALKRMPTLWSRIP